MRSFLSSCTRAALAATLVLGLVRPAQAVSIVPINLQDTIHEASAIFTGRVLKAQSRWGTPEQRWMVTDYLFAVDDAILPNGEVRTGGQVVLTWAGGQIGDRHQAIASLEMPSVGNSYLLMLRNDWNQPRITPEVVPNMGLFRLVAKNGGAEIQQAEGQPLFKLTNGMIVRDWEVKGVTATKGISLPAFTSWVRTNLARIKASPITPQPEADPNDPHAVRTISLPIDNSPVVHNRVIVPESETKKPGAFEDTGAKLPSPISPVDQVMASGARPSAQSGPSPVAGNSEEFAASTFGLKSANYKLQWSRFNIIPGGRLRIVWNQLPTDGSFSPWSPEDQYQMSKSNHWADIMRVLVTPTGNWAWQNGRYDICGWPSSAQMLSQFGQGWGANTLAICWTSWDGSGITESDIAFNPAFSWTLNDEAVYDNTTSAWPFRSTMVHELGHSWGLNHQFNFISIMNYMEKEFRMFGFQYMDDAEAIRASYPAYAGAHSNLANYMYYSAAYQNWNDLNMDSTVVAGNNMDWDTTHIENVGSANLPSTPIQWYLTPQRDYSAYYYLGTSDFGGLNRFQYFNPASVSLSMQVPYGTPAGYHYLNSWMPSYNDTPGQGSFPFSNQMGWSRNRVYVYPRVYWIDVSFNPAMRNSTVVGTLHLYGASDGRYFSLSSNDTNVATVPASVFIPAGEYSASFNISVKQGAAAANCLITASSNGESTNVTLYAVPKTTLTMNTLTGAIGQKMTLQATLKNSVNSKAVASKYVYFYVDGTYVGYGFTDATGKAKFVYPIPEELGLGVHTTTGTFFTDYDFYGSSGNGKLTVTKSATKLTTSAVTTQIGKLNTFKGTLKRSTDSAALAGRTLNFYVNLVFVGSGVTDAAGVASTTHKFEEGDGVGTKTLTVNFGGDALYNDTTISANVTVQQSATKMTLKAPATARGAVAKLDAVLQRSSDSAYLNGKSVSFYLDGNLIGSATMAANHAILNYTIPMATAPGTHTVRVDYAGNAAYLPVSKTANISIK